MVRNALARDSPASDVQRAAWFYQLIRFSYASSLDSYGSQPHDTISSSVDHWKDAIWSISNIYFNLKIRWRS